MDRYDAFYTFDFEDKDIFYNDIESVTAIQLDAPVLDGKRHLSGKARAAEMEFMA
jgi:hypothetical protein